MSKHFSLRTSVSISALIALGGGLEILKNSAIAFRFGSGAETDAFFAAYVIPNTYGMLWASATVAGLVPLFSAWQKEQEERPAISAVILLSAVFSSFIAGTAYLAASVIARLLVPGFSEVQREHVTSVFRLLTPLFVLIGLTGVGTAFLNTNRKFLLPTANKIIINLVIIAGLLAFSGGIRWLAILVVVGAFLHTAFLFIRILQVGAFRTLDWRLRRSQIAALLSGVVVPFVILIVRQASSLADRVIGSYLPSGSISALSYGYLVVAGLGTVINVGVSTPIMPALASESSPEVKSTLIWQALEYLLVLMMPLACGFFLLAGPLASLLFRRGAFNAASAAETAQVIAAYAFGLLFASIGTHLQTVFWADRRYVNLIGVNALISGLNIVFDVVLGFWLGAKGLAWGYTLASLVYALVAAWYLRLSYGPILNAERRGGIARTAAMTALMALCVYLLRNPVGDLSSFLSKDSRQWQAIIQLALLTAIGGSIVLVVGLAAKVEPVSSVLRSMYNRLTLARAAARG